MKIYSQIIIQNVLFNIFNGEIIVEKLAKRLDILTKISDILLGKYKDYYIFAYQKVMNQSYRLFVKKNEKSNQT